MITFWIEIFWPWLMARDRKMRGQSTYYFCHCLLSTAAHVSRPLHCSMDRKGLCLIPGPPVNTQENELLATSSAGSCTPKTMPSLYFHISPGISQPPERWNKQELPFPLNFGENEAQRSKMTSADTSGDSNHRQTAWLTVLHSSHTPSGSQNLLF